MTVRVVALTLEVAAGVAVQASGLGGTGVAVAAWSMVLAGLLFLLRQWRETDFVEPLRAFVIDRRRGAPPAGGPAAADYARDTEITYYEKFGRAVARRTRYLRRRRLIGPNEAYRLTHPRTLNDIEDVVQRLTHLEHDR